MTHLLRRRLSVFCGIFAFLILIVGWSAVTAWRNLGNLRSRFTSAQFESFRVASELQSSVQSLNLGLLAYEIRGEEADWQQFQHDTHALDTWIGLQRSALKTNNEKRALDEIDAEYDRYMAVAQVIHREHIDRTEPIKSQVQQLNIASQQMLLLGTRLAEAHRQALVDYLGESQHALRQLEGVFGGAFVLVLALGGWGASVLFRETITPLRKQLVEFQTLAERHEKLASLGTLAAGVAHEIRNPLMAIKLRVHLIRQEIEGGAPKIEDVSLIDKEIDRLECIVTDFLHFAKPSDPQFTTFVAQTFLQEVCELLAPEFEKSGITLVVESGANDATLRADPSQLKQVLINLVRNAAESIGKNGRIRLRARRARLPLEGHPREVVVLEIQDTGAGIPAELQDRLFDPFFTTKSVGTGLGLSIAIRILELHGGTLQYETVPGLGTTFGVVLPKPSDELRAAFECASGKNTHFLPHESVCVMSGGGRSVGTCSSRKFCATSAASEAIRPSGGPAPARPPQAADRQGLHMQDTGSANGAGTFP